MRPDEQQVHAMLLKVFGSGTKITMGQLTDADTVEGKVIQYTSDFRNLESVPQRKSIPTAHVAADIAPENVVDAHCLL